MEFNVWDIGGPASMATVNQCFFTDKALYVVVWNLALGEEAVASLQFWLLSIEVRARGPRPVTLAREPEGRLSRRPRPVARGPQRAVRLLLGQVSATFFCPKCEGFPHWEPEGNRAPLSSVAVTWPAQVAGALSEGLSRPSPRGRGHGGLAHPSVRASQAPESCRRGVRDTALGDGLGDPRWWAGEAASGPSHGGGEPLRAAGSLPQAKAPNAVVLVVGTHLDLIEAKFRVERIATLRAYVLALCRAPSGSRATGFPDITFKHLQ